MSVALSISAILATKRPFFDFVSDLKSELHQVHDGFRDERKKYRFRFYMRVFDGATGRRKK